MSSTIQRVSVASACVVSLLSFGCTKIYSPPSQTVTAEAPGLLAPGQTSVRGDVSLSAEGMGPGLLGFGASARHGLLERVEIQGGMTATYVGVENEDDGTGVGNQHRGIYSGRFGVKLKIIEHVAVSAGVGGGIAPAAGGYLSPDVNLIVGYENPYLVPFGTFRVYYSAPVGAKDVVVDVSDGRTERPRATIGTSLFAGGKVPIGNRENDVTRTTGNVYFGAGPTWTFDMSDQPESDSANREVYVHFLLGGEVVLPMSSAAARRAQPSDTRSTSARADVDAQ